MGFVGVHDGRRKCKRVLSEEERAERAEKVLPMKPFFIRHSWIWTECGGHLRALYMRRMEKGAARGWVTVGTICLRCFDKKWDTEALLPLLDRHWQEQVRPSDVKSDPDSPSR